MEELSREGTSTIEEYQAKLTKWLDKIQSGHSPILKRKDAQNMVGKITYQKQIARQIESVSVEN